MSKRYVKPMTVDELVKVKDEEVDFSDIPELDEAFWNEARISKPDRTQHVTLRIKKSVLDHFKSGGRGYQTRINAVLESYVRSRQMRGDGAA